MLKIDRILLFGATFFLSLLTAEEPLKIDFKPMKFGGSEEFGSVSQMLINSEQTFFTKGEWLDHFGTYFVQEATIDDCVEVAVGLGGVFQFPKQERAQEKYGGSQYKLFFVGPAVAKAMYNFGDFSNPTFSLGGGMFPYKYNSDAVNLGEYLFRSTPYPTTLVTGGLNTVNDNSAYLQGFMARFKKGQYQLDLLLPTQTSMPPLYDFSLAFIAEYTSKNGILNLGAGVNLNRLIPVKPSRTSRKIAGNSYFSKNGKDYTGNTNYYTNAAKFYKTKGDTVQADFWQNQADSVLAWEDPTSGIVPGSQFYSTAGTVAMVHGSIAIGQLINSEKLGKKDLRLFFESAILGVQNFPVFYTNRMDRVPLMIGFNLPTFKYLDLFSVQWERFKSPYLNSTYSLGATNSAVPRFENGNNSLYSQDDYMDVTQKDDYSWSILAKKTFLKSFTISGQIARDHLRTVGTNWFYGTRNEPSEVLRTSSDWYWMTQFSWNI